MKNRLMIERNTELNEGKVHRWIFFGFFCMSECDLLRHNIIELIETEKEYVKDLALIVEVEENNFLLRFFSLHPSSFRDI